MTSGGSKSVGFDAAGWEWAGPGDRELEAGGLRPRIIRGGGKDPYFMAQLIVKKEG